MDCLIQLIFLLFFFGVVVLSIISKTDQGREFWRRFFKKYWYLPVLLPTLPLAINFFIKGPNYGFNPDYVFDCQRATKKCEYHQSMLFDKNRELHLVNTYDISKATSAKVKKFSSPLQYSDYYEIFFVSADGEFYMPGWFPSFEEAEEEAAKINSFLKNKKKNASYRYEHFTPQTGLTFKDVVIFLAVIGIVLYGVHLYKKRKKKKPVQVQEPLSDSPRYHKNPYLCFAAALLFGYSLLFEDMYSTFDCRSDTQKCEYYSSTLITRELKPAGTYDISEITRTEVQRTNRKRRFYDNHPYRIRFVSHNDSFSMPQEFSSFDNAANEAAKIDAFLTRKEASYHYEASRPTSETVFHIIITPALFIYGLILYGRKKEREREEGKKQRSVFPAPLRRKPHSSQKLPVKKDDTDV